MALNLGLKSGDKYLFIQVRRIFALNKTSNLRGHYVHQGETVIKSPDPSVRFYVIMFK